MRQKEVKIIKAPKLSEVVNKTFVPLWNSTDRFNILYGSRGSSKSDFVAYKILNKMINDNYFKGIAIMKVKENIERNLFGTVMKVMERYGLEKLFKTKKSPFEIKCIHNNNVLYFGGLSDPSSYRGVSDPTFLWFEETPPETEEEWSNISLTLRSSKANLQEYYTINPIIEDYEEHWFYKKFFKDERDLAFRKKIEIENEDGKKFTQWATIHHSTYKDNRFLGENEIAGIELLALGSPYLYQVFKLGIWANKIIEGRYYNKYDPTIHITDKKYNPDKPLHISWDFNRLPYSGVTVYQVYGKDVYCIDEICVMNKDSDASSLKQSCDRVKQKYPDHSEGIFIYGDPSGRQEDAKTEKGHNAFYIIQEELKQYKPQLRVPAAAPSQKMAGEFINSIFAYKTDDISIYVHTQCKELIKDLMYMKMDKEGGIEIEYIKNDDNVKIEKYGHQGANFRYFLTTYFNDEFNIFKNPSSFNNTHVGKTRSQIPNKHRW